MTMKLSDLILAVGDESISFQNLDEDTVDVKANTMQTRITFVTSPMDLRGFAIDGRTEMLGLVVWLPRDKVKAALESGKESV